MADETHELLFGNRKAGLIFQPEYITDIFCNRKQNQIIGKILACFFFIGKHDAHMKLEKPDASLRASLIDDAHRNSFPLKAIEKVFGQKRVFRRNDQRNAAKGMNADDFPISKEVLPWNQGSNPADACLDERCRNLFAAAEAHRDK